MVAWRKGWAFGLSVAIVGLCAALVQGQGGFVGWPNYGGDKAFTRYSPLSQIGRDNVKSLRVVWRAPAVDPAIKKANPDLRVNAYLRSTPLMIDGILYTQDAMGLAMALNAETGVRRWTQALPDPSMLQGQAARGIDMWTKGDGRIVAVRGEHLYALSKETGAAYRTFGEAGRVTLERDSPRAGPYRLTSGPLIVGEVVILAGQGGGGGDSASIKKEAAPEDIRGYDIRTGRLLWTFHVVPRPGEFGADTWDPAFLQDAGDLGAWAALSADEELGLVYVPLSVSTAAYYGGHRRGNNLFSASLVALDAKTGKRVWHHQMFHHVLGEYDNISPATLGDITVDGRRIKAVMAANKNGFLFVLDRATGRPVWPIEERSVPQSTVPGEHSSPTQPFPTKPPAFDRQGVTDDDLIDFTPALRQQARDILKDYVTGPMYTPPSLLTETKKGTYFVPGNWGAGNWHTGAFDPETGMYYAVSHTMPGMYDLVEAEGVEKDATMRFVAKSKGRNPPTIDGLPLVKPPYGRVTALNLNTGELAWMAANGDGPRTHPLLKDLNLPPLGIPNRPAPLLTKTLLFLGEGSDAITGAWPYPWAWGKKFRAYDKASGAVVWEMDLPSGTTAAPMTYMNRGKQYIVVAVGDRNMEPEFVALALQ